MLDTNEHTFNVNISSCICQILLFSTVYKRKMKEGKEAEMMESLNPIINLSALAHFEFLGVQPRSLTE